MKKIFVAGHRGMVGSAICRKLVKESDVKVITRGRDELDLCNQSAVQQFISQLRVGPYLKASALRSGGIPTRTVVLADFDEISFFHT